MYFLANRIAYDGSMVYGTIAPSPEKETRASLSTGWIHVSGTSQGNWVPAEGKALQELLTLLRKDGVEAKEISVITPFTDVRKNLERIVDPKMVFGTIHTMQGKEAPVVIMVLGGNTAGSGARNWAVSEPNLLNVAATRAKRRLYVIGDRNDWENRSLFCDVMDLLPIQKIPTREQEQRPWIGERHEQRESGRCKLESERPHKPEPSSADRQRVLLAEERQRTAEAEQAARARQRAARQAVAARAEWTAWEWLDEVNSGRASVAAPGLRQWMEYYGGAGSTQADMLREIADNPELADQMRAALDDWEDARAKWSPPRQDTDQDTDQDAEGWGYGPR